MYGKDAEKNGGKRSNVKKGCMIGCGGLFLLGMVVSAITRTLRRSEAAALIESAKSAYAAGNPREAVKDLTRARETLDFDDPDYDETKRLLGEYGTKAIEDALRAARAALKEGDLKRAAGELEVAEDLRMSGASGEEEAQALLEECETAASDEAISSAFAGMSDAEFQSFTTTGELPAKTFFADPDVNRAFAMRLNAKRESAALLRKVGLESREATQRWREKSQTREQLEKAGLVQMGVSLEDLRSKIPALANATPVADKGIRQLQRYSWRLEIPMQDGHVAKTELVVLGPADNLARCEVRVYMSQTMDVMAGLILAGKVLSVITGESDDAMDLVKWAMQSAQSKSLGSKAYGQIAVAMSTMPGAVTITIRHRDSTEE